ncbi:HAD-IA family hydrolase [Rhodosalinus sp.]|uniref:HAD-IA family hydrolase n=1 Tax=Rhodosalinus sp. TaxID=2047741 RepID=UPI00397E6B91
MRLVVFDVDGTLVDSQADILGAMAAAFGAMGLAMPEKRAVLNIVGLSLDHAMPRLAPDLPFDAHAELVHRYKEAYAGLRARGRIEETSPLYPGAREILDLLSREDDLLLGIATGKSRRGLDVLLQAHGLGLHFVTQQVADHHPSKPHPSMLLSALAETGVDPHDAVRVGDTSYDMEMARAAGLRAVGVRWGYHAEPALAAADVLIDRWADFPRALDRLQEVA